MLTRRTTLAATMAGLGAPPFALAQSEAWPNRPIRIIVPFPPGGAVDMIARIMQQPLADTLGRSVVIDNRSGGSGSVGAIEAARSAPDGYTWFIAFDNEAVNQSLMQLPYRAIDAFAPVTLMATGPMALVAHPSRPLRSFADVLQAARQRPDALSYATGGIGSLAHVAATLLQQQAAFRMVHVPYRGGAPALQDSLANVVPLFMSNLVLINQHVRSGALRPLGVTTRGESRHLPGVPSFVQQGVADFEALTWFAFLGRAGTPEPIMARMHQAVTRVLRDPAVQPRIEDLGCDIVAGTPAECGRFFAAEIEKWGRVVREHGITVDS
jgi:tripartite-type tricarboxylate transporter receptor subunit TctC